MDKNRFCELKRKVKEAEKLQDNIDKINEIYENIEITGRCMRIEFDYWEHHSEPGWGNTEEEGCRCTQIISAETLGISEEEFIEWFSKPLVNYIVRLKEKLQNDFSELEIS